MKQTQHAIKSRELIDTLGGCAAIARRLGFDNTKQEGTRTVYSWYRNGIPSKWQLEHEWLRVL